MKKSLVALKLIFMMVLLNQSLTARIKSQKLPTGFYKVVEKSPYYITNTAFHEKLFIDTIPVCTIRDIKKISLNFNSQGFPVISLQLGEEGTEKFAKATRENIGKKIAIIADGQLLSAPVVRAEIAGGRLEVAGSFSVPEAEKIIEGIKRELPSQLLKPAEEEKKENAINEACTRLDMFLMHTDTIGLKNLLHDKLSMGHSNGLIETKKELLQHLKTSHLKYNSIEGRGYNEVQFVSDIASVRRLLKVEGSLTGKPFDLTLKVLEIWIFEDGHWKLLSRQSVKKI